jgi:hypothetical protein
MLRRDGLPFVVFAPFNTLFSSSLAVEFLYPDGPPHDEDEDAGEIDPDFGVNDFSGPG